MRLYVQPQHTAHSLASVQWSETVVVCKYTTPSKISNIKQYKAIYIYSSQKVICNRRTFCCNDVLFDIMTYFVYFLTSWRTFWRHHALFEIMTYFAYVLMARCTFWNMRYFWRYDVHYNIFWRHDILSIFCYVIYVFFLNVIVNVTKMWKSHNRQ